MVDVGRDELAYKSEVKLTGYCNAENDENNNLWVTMESPFLTKKITQKFPTLPGYTIPETNTRAIGNNEIEITTNGNYILGQNDEDPDDLEMDIDNTNNNNNSKKLTLLKNQTRDDITSNYVLGKLNINIPSPTITSPITSNGYYKFDGNTLISGTEQDYNIYVSTPPISNKVVFYSMNHNGDNYLFSTFSNTSSTISLPANSTTLLIYQRTTYYIFKVYKNTSSSSVSYSNADGTNYYYKSLNTASNNRIIFIDLNNTRIFELNLVVIKDNYESIIFPRLFRDYFDIKFQ